MDDEKKIILGDLGYDPHEMIPGERKKIEYNLYDDVFFKD